jgi:hypothetical protein
MAHPFRYLIVASVLLGAARAQSPVPAVRFSVFSLRPIEGVAFTPKPDAAVQPIVSYPTARSPRYDYRGPVPLRFTDAKSGAVVAEATIPADIHDALLLFSAVEPAPVSGLRYKISVLDDSAARNPSGGLAVINLSGLELAGTIGTKDVVLSSGLNPPIAIGKSAKVVLRTSVKDKSPKSAGAAKALQSYAGSVQLRGNQRALLILFPPFYKGSVEVQSRLLIDEPAR